MTTFDYTEKECYLGIGKTGNDAHENGHADMPADEHTEKLSSAKDKTVVENNDNRKLDNVGDQKISDGIAVKEGEGASFTSEEKVIISNTDDNIQVGKQNRKVNDRKPAQVTGKKITKSKQKSSQGVQQELFSGTEKVEK